MYSTIAWGKASPEAKFEKIKIERNVAGDEDVTFDVKFCGICHTDVHIAGNDMVSCGRHNVENPKRRKPCSSGHCPIHFSHTHTLRPL